MRYYLIIILLNWFSLSLVSQPENSVWVFGSEEDIFKLDFNQSTLEVEQVVGQSTFIKGSEISTSEVSASISDSDGKLIYYTNGVSIYDRNLNRLPSGDQIFADLDLVSSKNGAVFLPYPGNPDLMMLFYLTELQENSRPELITSKSAIRYLIIDNRLNDGLGDVISGQTNILLGEFYAEGFTIIPGPCESYWLVARKRNTKEMHAFKIDYKGVHPPVISEVIQADRYLLPRTQWTLLVDVGSIQYNDHTGILIMSSHSGIIEKYKFNKNTGELFEPMVIEQKELSELVSNGMFSTYRQILISRSGCILFAKEDAGDGRNPLEKVSIYKYNLCLESEDEIINSKSLVGTYDSHHEGDDLLLHPYHDDEFIVAKSKVSSIGLIKCDLTSDSCWYIDEYLELPFAARNTQCLHHPVTISQNRQETTELITWIDSTICTDGIVSISISGSYDSVIWDNSINTRDIVLTEAGQHHVIAYEDGCVYYDTVEVYVRESVGDLLPTDSILCTGESLTIQIPDEYEVYTWEDGSTVTSRALSGRGTYWVSYVDSIGCEYIDSIQIEERAKSEWHIEGTEDLCTGETISLGIDLQADRYEWSTGDTTQDIEISSAGLYEVRVSIDGCVETAIIEIELSSDCGVTMECSVYLPNALQSDSQRGNGQFVVESSCVLLDYELQIYDRWGNEMYYSRDATQGWDGSYGDSPAMSGVYLYQLHYRHSTDEPIQTATGTITLFR